MNICLLSHSYPPSIGGVATSVKRLALMLKEKGFSIVVSTLSHKLLPGEEKLVEEEGILVSRLGKFPEVSDTKTSWFELLCTLVDKYKINLIHSYYLSRAGFIGVMAAKFKGIKSIVSIRGNDLEKDIFSGKEFPLMEWALKNSDSITSVSQNLAHMAGLIVPEKKIHVIHNSVNSDFFKKEQGDNEILEKLSIPADEPLTGFIGEARPKKGIYTLLKSFETVIEHRKAHLFIIGTIRQDMTELIKFFREKNANLKNYIHVLPAVLPEYIVKFYNMLDIFVMPSLRDGMPNAILEAMACELPVVTTSAGAEVVKDGETGIVVKPADEDNLSLAIIKLLESKELREKMGRAGRERVKENFSPLKELEENMKLYSEIFL